MKRREFLAAAAVLAASGARAAGNKQLRLISAAQLRGVLAAERGRVVVLNLWATWCAPCLREIPDLVRLEQQFAPRGLVLIGVAMDEPDELDTRVAPFRQKYFPQFRTYLRAEHEIDAIASVVDPAWNEVLPTTYLIGRDGRLLRRVQGAKTHDEFSKLISAAL